MQGDGLAGRDARGAGPGARRGLRALSGPFRHRLRVRYHECDPQGVVFNAHYLAYFDIALTELWRERLGGYASFVSKGLDVVVAEATVRYHEPLRFDEEFDVALWFADLGTTSLHSELRIERDGTPIAEGAMRHVLIELKTGEKTPIPDAMRRALETVSGSGGAGT